MIPISVRMKGWMRYREEQKADFREGNLIAICGENGAGKSAIFDAITFALYGRHRLGKQKVEQLISEDMDYAAVDFEFEVGADRYLVHRGRGKKTGDGKQSLYVWDGDGGDWAPVPGTEKEDTLERSIRKITRLSYEAFASSFMLQQGEATEFIDADPKARFDILSSLIGLEAYKELEKRSREAEKTAKDRLKWINEKLAEIGDIDETTIAALRASAIAAGLAEADAAAIAQAAKAMLADAGRYSRLTEEIAQIDAKISAANELLAQREQIERDASLYEMLSKATETVGRVRSALADASRAQAVADDARKQAESIDITMLTKQSEGALANVDATTRRVEAGEKAAEGASQAERSAHDFGTLATAVLEGRHSVASFEQRLREIDAQLKNLSAAGKTLDAEAAAARGALDKAEAALEIARKDGAGWRAQAEELKRQLAERKAASKEATCSRCGQRIDKATAKAQIDELTAALGEAQSRATAATGAEQAAQKACAAAKKAGEDAVRSAGAHAQQISGLDGERRTADASKAKAATALAEREGQLNGRMKDVETAVAAHAAAAERLASIRAALDQERAAHREATSAEQQARTALDEGKSRLSELESAAREQAAVADGHRKAAEATADGLGELREDALEDPTLVLQTLTKNQKELAGAAKRKEALDKAQQTHTAASAQREAKAQEIETIPAPQRVDEAAAKEAALESSASWERARVEQQQAQQALAAAEAQLAQASGMREDAERTALRHKRLNKLTALLGKNGLQGALVADALDQISSHANAFLKRLTGGTLLLNAERSKEGDSLELKAIDSTCMREPHPVKVLSGSQKFRCAVAIASGIGQYAGAGGMRSIVIDEGFASLDRESQKTMVGELKELATHMDKVIVVSHLEAFADPVDFPHQVRVETHGNASVIT